MSLGVAGRPLAAARPRAVRLLLCLAALLLAPATAAFGAGGLYVSGAGYGPGVGMSQYGAAGYALHGASYQQILADYYARTTLGEVNPRHVLTVLLRAGGQPSFSAATRVVHSHVRLNPSTLYTVLAAGTRLRLVAGGVSVGVFRAPLVVRGRGPVVLAGSGPYAGALSFRPSPRGRGVMTINAVGLDAYVRGVVAAEMPSSWPAQALEAQAVAARSYAYASTPVSPYYDLYASARSQLYLGVRAQTPASDAAVAATSGQVVEYQGVPVVTYFFTSSGGETESVQNVFASAAQPWLVGVPDPYDDSLRNPYYRWRRALRLRLAQARLGRLVRGRLRGIRVTQRGVSPRIVRAEVVGTRGVVGVSGATLRQLLGTPSTWMSFRTVTAQGVQTGSAPQPAPATTSPAQPTPTTNTAATTTPATGGGGLAQVRRAARTTRLRVAGSVFPVSAGARVRIERLAGGRWSAVGSTLPAATGRYALAVAAPGRYRVLYAGVTGPVVRLR
jgi:stage II sporulation protein D